MKKTVFITVITLLLCAIVGTTCFCGYSYAPKPAEKLDFPLSFHDGKFTVLQMSDFHEYLGIEGANSIDISVQTTLKPLLTTYINSVLDTVNPDFVVLTGDNIFSLSSFADIFESLGVKTYKAIADLFEGRKQYWTFCFGNHDSESAATKTDFLSAVLPYKYFIGGFSDGEYFDAAVFTEEGNSEKRIGNYSIPIYSDTEIKYNLYLLDSGSNSGVVKNAPYRYILDNQVDWFKNKANDLKKRIGKPVPSVIFTHIPLIEHREAFAAAHNRIGEFGGISPSNTRSKLFEAAMECGGVRGIFVGHNHDSSFTCFYSRGDQKIMMGITPQAAASSYSAKSGLMRSRVLELSEDGNLTTYIHTNNTAYPDGVDRNEIMAYGF